MVTAEERRKNTERMRLRRLDPKFKETAKRRRDSLEYKTKWKLRRQSVEAARMRSERDRLRMATDFEFKVGQHLSHSMGMALKGNKAGRHWEDIVGYSAAELRAHLEKLWHPGMTWENYGTWHVDHKIPKSWWKYNSPDDNEFKQCWSLCNLQPLWGKDNARKSNKYAK